MKELLEKIVACYRERDWEKFHLPKNLVLNLMSELGELAEHFRWLSDAESLALTAEQKEGVRDEIADVFITLIYLADKLGIDLIEAGESKLTKIAMRYPKDLCRGKTLKYTAYSDESR